MTIENGPAPFKILSLDGGGIKGTFTAAFLAELEAMTGRRVLDYFDLIAGTSTGGIIAVALALQVPAAELLKLYVEQGPRIFTNPWPWPISNLCSFLHRLFWPKHRRSALEHAVKGVIGDRLFGEAETRLVIPAFDGVQGAVHLFKTSHTENHKRDYLLPAAEIACATASAPTYFSAQTPLGCYVDGGVWANCPVMVGLLEAIYVLKRKPENIEILSIGTTSAPYYVRHKQRTGGLMRWGPQIVDFFMEAQISAALGEARLITDGRLLRIDATVNPGRFSLDNASEIHDLTVLGQQLARKHEKELSARFLSARAQPFVPCHKLEKKLPDSAAGHLGAF